MDYIECVQKSLDYIEENLEDQISLEKLAEVTFCSKFHFHRLFTALVGMNVIEYVRKRRLTVAAQRLRSTNQSIIQLAMETGFNSHAAFTRAFKNAFGVLPDIYRRGSMSIELFDRVDIRGRKLIDNKTGCLFGPRILQKDSFTVVGMEMTCSFEKNRKYRMAPNLWNKVVKRRYELNGFIERWGYGVAFESIPGDYFSYMASYEVNNNDYIPKGMKSRTIPSSTYASFLFHYGPDIQRFYEALEYIYGIWLPLSGYTLSTNMDLIEVFDMESGVESNEIWMPLNG